jgi:hypothetical protein
VSGDLEEAVKMLAADNARMCDILLAADKLAKTVEKYAKVGQRADLEHALDAYKIVRQGQ